MDHSRLDKTRGGSVQLKRYEEMLVKSKLGTSRYNEPLQAVIENKLHESALSETNNSILERNRALLQYIATIANSNSNTDEFNYEFVESLVKGGAEINIGDQYGQTIFHEVARSWNVDVARFLLELGCNIDKQDSFGRSPLHVAAAVDHVQMTEFLLQNNADMDARTLGEYQAPIHYAAKNGAMRSLKMLLGFQANINSADANQRTPLQLAAEWTRAETAKVLIDEGAASCVLDTSGNSALCVLIDRLPNLALEALSQLHTTDVITMKDSYYLQYLEASRRKIETKATRTPLETAVTTRKNEVVTHPVMQRLIYNKWIQYGRRSTMLDLLFHVIFGVTWTSICMGTPAKGKELYVPPEDNVWRIVLGVFVLLMTVFDIGRHIHATRKSRKSQKNWIDWRISQLEEDMKYCHPRWPQERKYIEHEIKRVKSLPLFDDFGAWFYLEWITLILILATITTHFVFYEIDTSATRYIYTRTISIVNLLVWLRLLKYLRPFPGIGTLVIILGETTGDFVNWAFLFLLLLIPFSAAFWINFGDISIHPVEGFHDTAELLYSVFRIAVGDDFNFEGLAKADPVMSRILIVIYVTAVTIVTLNLLIALLSDTFSRVYSNAVANTIMQRAIKVVEAERTLTKHFKLKYLEHMKSNCSPEVIKMSYEGKIPDTPSERAEQEVYLMLQAMNKLLNDRFSKVYGQNKTSDFDAILGGVRKLKEDQEYLSNDLKKISELVKQLAAGNGQKRSGSRALEKSKRDSLDSSTPTSPLHGLFTRNKQESSSSIFNIFSFTKSKKETEPSRGDKKRSRRYYSDDDTERERKSTNRGRRRRRRSEKTWDNRDGTAYNHSPTTTIVPYNHSNGRAHEIGSGYVNRAYVNERGSDSSDLDQLSQDSIDL